MSKQNWLEEIINRHEDDKEVAEYAGITLTLEDYNRLIEEAKLAEAYHSAIHKFFELDGSYHDIVDQASSIFDSALDGISIGEKNDEII